MKRTTGLKARDTENLHNRVRRDRIRVAVAAWAYEKGPTPSMSDQEYDALSLRVHKYRKVATGNSRLDNFFKRHFDHYTSLWIHKHPDQEGLRRIYLSVYRNHGY